MNGQLGLGNLPVYSGSRYQVGAGLLSSMKAMIIPFAKQAGKEALRTAAGQLPNLMGALARGKEPSEALKDASREVVSNVGSKAARQFAETFAVDEEPAAVKTVIRRNKRPATTASTKGLMGNSRVGKNKRRRARKRADIFD